VRHAVKRLGLSLFAAFAALAVLTAAALAATTTDPRAEKERLNPADMALAKRANLKAADLDPAWRRIPVPESDDQSFTCPGFDPDFSAFTITGKSESAFDRGSGGSILSVVEVYATERQAIGDFSVGTRPAIAGCLKHAAEQGFKAGGPGVTARVVSSKVVAAPRVGDRQFAVRLVARVTAGGRSIPLVMDVVVLQRGRSIAALMFTGLAERVSGQAPLARLVASRMR
jgi:hypothetical protein